MAVLSLLLALLFSTVQAAGEGDLRGAWQMTRDDGVTGTMIVTDTHFSIGWYRKDPAKFVSTEGGTWTRAADGSAVVTYEFHTANPDLVGTSRAFPVTIAGNELRSDRTVWTRIDDGAPGALQGAWLMTGRKRDGEISTRTPGARRTMKILSGTRFQWIAYNVETKQFFGSGGGAYTTADGVYTETIEFFSRDDAKAGLKLPFNYTLPDGVWHHDGKSTAGEPMYEIWEKREKIGV